MIPDLSHGTGLLGADCAVSGGMVAGCAVAGCIMTGLW